MNLISWNVNGIRAAMGKGLARFANRAKPDILCLQETKARPEQLEESWLPGYHGFWNSADKPGYSGTVVYTKRKPVASQLGIGKREHDTEGRVVTLEFDTFYLVNVYTPNSQRGLSRLEYRQNWDRAFLRYLRRLEKDKPVVFCGDLNVAHREIDLANPKANRKNAGFTDEERAGFDRMLKADFVDTFRTFNQDPGHYTWWTFRNDARARNIGWRLDYWLVSGGFLPNVKQSAILADVTGSDHCPVMLTLKRGIK